MQAKIVSFYGNKFSFTATRQRSGKTRICDRNMIQFMPANHSNKSCYHITITIMNILMNWSYNETFVIIFLRRWHFYPTTNVFLSMLYFYIWTNVNTKELMQFQYDIDTSTTVNNYGLLEMKGETRWLGMSVFTCGLSEHAIKCQRHRKRHRKSLHEIIEIGSMWYLNISRACVGHCLVILKCSCRNYSSKTCSTPIETQAQILELRSRSPKSVVNESKIYNSLLYLIAETHPPYTTDGQYNKQYEYVS